jgi:plastocyanin
MRVRKNAFLTLLLTAGLVATACGQADSDEAEGGTITVAGMSANNHGTKDVSGESELDLELDDFYFEPTVLTGTAGQTVTIELENEGDAKHNFSLPEQAVDQDVESGQKAQVEVSFPDSGTLVFFCKYHQSMGMRGALRAG